jgi:hypothetical protein
MGYMHKELEDMEFIPAPAGTATPKTQHATEDGKTLVYGTTAPSDAATGYAPGCLFIDTDSGAQYINEGTSASADFNKVVTLGSNDMAGTAAGAGPSPLIWDDSKLLEVMLDPTAGFYYFDDYLGPIDVTTGDGFTITAVTTGGVSAVADEDGGVLLVDSQGNASADDGVNVQLTNCMFKPAAGRTIRFEARVKFVDAGDDQYFVGLAGVDTTLIAAGVVDDVVDKCGFFRHAASTADKISSICSRTSTEDITADVGDIVDDTYVKLGFVINGLTSVEFYVDGVLVETGSTAAAIPNAVMCLSYVAQCEQTSADAEMSVDWVRILQEGTRS